MKVAIYCRVSTDSPEREGTSLETHPKLGYHWTNIGITT